MLLFYIVQIITVLKLCIFQRYMTISLYDPVLSGANVAPTSQVRSSAMLVLLIKKYEGSLQWNNVHTKFRQSSSTSSQIQLCGWTDR
jgi:hypothetical protein